MAISIVKLIDVIPSGLLWLSLVVTILITLFFSLILIYHWHKYGYGSKIIATAEIVYLTILALLILFSMSLINLFENL